MTEQPGGRGTNVDEVILPQTQTAMLASLCAQHAGRWGKWDLSFRPRIFQMEGWEDLCGSK